MKKMKDRIVKTVRNISNCEYTKKKKKNSKQTKVANHYWRMNDLFCFMMVTHADWQMARLFPTEIFESELTKI